MEKHNESDIALNIIIQDKKGNHITGSCKLYVYLSKNALLEFGKELINNALHAEYSDVYHFYPAGSGIGISVNFGIIVHPESIEPIIIDDMDPIASNALNELVRSAENLISKQKPSSDTQIILTDNIVLFKVLDNNNNDISKDCQYVVLYLHKYSKITLGMALIRLAHNFEEGKEIHIIPASKEEAQQAMGVFLTPDSCELVIQCKSFDPIDKILEEYEKEHK